MMQKTLTETVRLSTGIPEAEARPGQVALLDDIEAAIEATGHVCGVAPTGVGKSFSLLAPAMVAAAKYGQRTIISTESLALLSQILHKDAPVAAEACEKVTGTKPKVAVLKGFSNYVCGQSARDAAESLTDTVGQRPSLPSLRAKVKRLVNQKNLFFDGRPFDEVNGVPLLLWALSLPADQAGDKQSYSGVTTPDLWDTVSVGPAECIGDTCPIFELCKPRTARAKAAEADIVVTNHSMLAVQAAKGVPVIIGNKTLGEFHIIMIDEAHALPANVRSAGASEVSAAAVMSLTKSVTRTLDESDSAVGRLIKEGSALALELEHELAEMAKFTKAGEVCKIKETADPVEATGDMLIAWARSVKGALDGVSKSKNTQSKLKAKRLAGRLDAFIGAVGQVKLHRIGTARWIEQKTPPANAKAQAPYWCANASPVNISGLLQTNLWTAPVMVDEEDEMVQAMREAGEPIEEETETYPMTVIAVSATLPSRFGYQVGLTAENVSYPSPFDKAYDDSLLYIPKLTPEEIPEMFPGWRPGSRGKFNGALHQTWATKKNVELVEANTGSALILSANASAGKEYAAALRRAAKGRWNVYSQWDGLSPQQLTILWREDVKSVLVGTKSFMTGVDAKGRTCSLVTIDRIPRAAGNPVDDARVEAIMDALQTSKWSADLYVYVSDAALLLEQALGRLIRSVSDFGMAAILDPRMLKTGPVSYPEPTRKVYKDAAGRFSKVTTSQAAAEEYLHRISAQAFALAS